MRRGPLLFIHLDCEGWPADPSFALKMTGRKHVKAGNVASMWKLELDERI